ncbi:MAG: tRNA 2-thiouridine(34) synthase MnmA [Thermoleophilaceae bacterium]
MRISVKVAGDRLVDAGFDASGCAAVRAAASMVVELVRGAPLLSAARISPAALADALGGLSPDRAHGAELAAEALHRALGALARDGVPELAPNERRTLVALSGGVDSAVAARLALDAGDEVVAVTLELWSDPAGDGTRSCCSPQAVTTARSLAHRMGIPHLTLDVRERFRAEVVDNFLGEQEAGRTPNPCVRCNGQVRFDVMLALAERLGAARLATGHYARIARDSRGALVRTARSGDKDQSYMLARLVPHDLERLWFPLGELDKPAVRGIARRFDLPVADRAESQDLCFLAGLGGDRFLRRHAPALAATGPGELVDIQGRVVGSHQGQQRFTVGQRRGIGLAAKEPLYVLHKDASSNRVTVGPRAALATISVELTAARLHRPAVEIDRVKLRYRSPAVGCRVVDNELPAGGHPRLRLSLERPVEGVAPGQTACLMRGESVVGWATIAARRRSGAVEDARVG